VRWVVVVHHEGKTEGKGPMGHTKHRAAPDTSISHPSNDGASVSVEMKDQRNGPCDLTLRRSIPCC
jgi:hypothetical protein